ncbi:DUF2088 domain-containing protein [Roseiconus nitratireducens]|uniref:DUF2088 domain-containing protein n=1 Tax=Roseiconus nitratireducens TaxID=2605748 RepID=A0A5M6DG42_9BACT|nr:lactate racemase domain-containing protein [Roseiconus nitratireducens]KAA5545179.1 DUF2088 domain-containing protein [Roseiconus nitratireducens]
MASREFPENVRFDTRTFDLASGTVWEFHASTDQTSQNVVDETIAALSAPDDFPPLGSAIVPGDRVAIAVDPNVPQIDAVLEGVLTALRDTAAEQIEIVVWDEATNETLDKIEKSAGGSLVTRHQCDMRQTLCYLAADVNADPIYLNRALVEADLVLPIIAVRPSEVADRRDLTGVFPSLSDSATRLRFFQKVQAGEANRTAMKSGNTIAQEVPWLLGVQLILAVTANSQGQAGEIRAGTTESLAQRISPQLGHPDPVPPPAALVIAALDGDQQQQTWENVVRAAKAAKEHAEPEGTIVIWSSLRQVPSGALLTMDDDPEGLPRTDRKAVEAIQDEPSQTLPRWDASEPMALTLQEILRQHRVLLHSELPGETVEPLGMGVIENAEQLSKLSQGFDTCAVLRAAQFASGQ